MFPVHIIVNIIPPLYVIVHFYVITACVLVYILTILYSWGSLFFVFVFFVFWCYIHLEYKNKPQISCIHIFLFFYKETWYFPWCAYTCTVSSYSRNKKIISTLMLFHTSECSSTELGTDLADDERAKFSWRTRTILTWKTKLNACWHSNNNEKNI